MAYVINRDAITAVARRAVEQALGNKVVGVHEDHYNDMFGVELIFALERAEAFGKFLRVQIPFSLGVPDPDQVVRAAVEAALEKLPRHDRIERERMLGIKSQPDRAASRTKE